LPDTPPSCLVRIFEYPTVGVPSFVKVDYARDATHDRLIG